MSESTTVVEETTEKTPIKFDPTTEVAKVEGPKIIVSPITGDPVELPNFKRKFIKSQKSADREFTASGPKADLIVAMILERKHTRAQIAKAAGASVSRVGEVIWTMEANLEGFKAENFIVRTNAVPTEVTADETDEATSEEADETTEASDDASDAA